MRFTKRLAVAATTFVVCAGTLASLATPAGAWAGHPHPTRPNPSVIVSHVVTANKAALIVDAKGAELWGVYIIKDYAGGAFYNQGVGLSAAGAAATTTVTAVGNGLITAAQAAETAFTTAITTAEGVFGTTVGAFGTAEAVLQTGITTTNLLVVKTVTTVNGTIDAVVVATGL